VFLFQPICVLDAAVPDISLCKLLRNICKVCEHVEGGRNENAMLTTDCIQFAEFLLCIFRIPAFLCEFDAASCGDSSNTLSRLCDIDICDLIHVKYIEYRFNTFAFQPCENCWQGFGIGRSVQRNEKHLSIAL